MYFAPGEELAKAKFIVKTGSASCADGEPNCRFPKSDWAVEEPPDVGISEANSSANLVWKSWQKLAS